MGFLTTPLDQALNSTSKIRLLRLLIEQDRTVSAREAARLTGMSRTAILVAIEDLNELGLIQREESGRQFLCRANREHKLIRFALVPLFQAEVMWPEMVVTAIREVLVPRADKKAKTLGKPIAAWIFGSVARGRDKPESDFDLFVLTNTDDEAELVLERIGEAVPRWTNELGADVRPVVMSQSKALLQHERGNPLIRSALRDARMIFGEVPKEFPLGQTNEGT